MAGSNKETPGAAGSLLGPCRKRVTLLVSGCFIIREALKFGIGTLSVGEQLQKGVLEMIEAF